MRPGAAKSGEKTGLRAIAALIGACTLLVTGCAGHQVPPTTRPVSVPAQAPAAAKSPVEPGEPRGVIHVVERGQTLWRIARAYGVDLDELARINRIEDPTDMGIGLRLFVPGATVVLEVPPADYVEPAGDADWLWPVRGGRLVSGFGAPRRTHRHQGIDIGGRRGEPVLASRAGVVIYSGSGMRGYGKTVILDHGDGTETLYAHNHTLAVRNGQRVVQGQRIAGVGRTGNASAEHCHFEVRLGDRAVDPMLYLRPTREAHR
jgi:murein DD-endopeptidase MepM/ murein hydrolase activator NlpD